MAKPKPPDRGRKFADLLKKEKKDWRLGVEASEYRWFRTPATMEAKDFELSGVKSLTTFQSFSYRKIQNDKQMFYYAVRAGYDSKHKDFAEDYAKTEILVGKSGRVFQAVEKAEIFQPEQRLYIKGLPQEVESADIKNMLKDYADFYEDTRKVLLFEQGRFSGKMMVKVKQIRKVPPPQIFLVCDHEDYNGLGIWVKAAGHDKETPVEKTTRKCFKCQGPHLAKDCTAPKMKFTWKCTNCTLTSLQCYEGHCAFDQMKKDTEMIADRFKHVNLSASDRVALADGIRLCTTQIYELGMCFRKSKDRRLAERRGLAIRRYLRRAEVNFARSLTTIQNFTNHFQNYLLELLRKINADTPEAIYEALTMVDN